MTADNWLFAFIVCVIGLAIWMVVTSDVDRDEEMWP